MASSDSGKSLPGTAPRGRLAATGITVHFGGLVAVDKAEIELGTGEVVGLIGPNGAGKTTLINVLTGFQKPDSGRVEIDGQELTGDSAQRHARSGIARTFQGARLFDDMSVVENVEVSGVGQGLSRRRARRLALEALELMRLTELAGRDASDLATGQERRLQVARAIATKPRFLVLDEPAAGLNESESAELLAVIRQVPELIGCGIILIDHDMQVVMNACSRIVVLDNGRVIASGGPDEVRTNPAVIDAYLGS